MLPEVLPTEAHAVAADTLLIPTLAPEPSGAILAANRLVIRDASR